MEVNWEVLGIGLGISAALVVLWIVGAIKNVILDILHERWLRYCHRCESRRNTFREPNKPIEYWCKVHGNYLVEKGSFGQ